MLLDDINIRIIQSFYSLKEGEKISLSIIRNKVFGNHLSISDKKKKLEFTRDRLNAMPREILGLIKNCDTIEYHLNSENVCFKVFTFPDSKSKGIAIKENDKWTIKQM